MGDRANVYVKDGEGGVYLYSHWGGTELPGTLQQAMKRKLRWDDRAYLARIIFCEMVAGQERDETGFGISPDIPDGADRVLIVDCDKKTISDVSMVDSSYNLLKEPKVFRVYTFEEFINHRRPQWAERCFPALVEPFRVP